MIKPHRELLDYLELNSLIRSYIMQKRTPELIEA